MSQDFYLFIGTYTEAKPDKGIYIYKFSSETGELSFVSHGENITNPSFLVVSSDGQFVYACTETQMANQGSISAFNFDATSGKISFINKVSSEGDNPVYLAIHKSGKWIVNGNYTGGSASVSRINENGGLEPSSQSFQFTGNSILKERQDAPHIHSTVFSPNHDYVYMLDLGSDKIWAFAFKPDQAQPLLKLSGQNVSTVPGSGPRHLTFHPNKKYAYCIEEMGGTIAAYRYNKGALRSIQRIVTHDTTNHGPYGSADIHISPDGKFLYASNRVTENNIAIFSINNKSGILTMEGIQSVQGDHPRNFIIDPTGNFILVANQNSNNVVVFKRNLESGLLQKTGMKISIPRPSCLQLLKIKQ